jgi:hypothetical protein
MATYWTLNNHLDNFQAFGDAHLQINSYSFGDLVKADLNTKKELFPVMHTQFVSCQPGTNILNWTFRFIFFDIPKDDDISSILECQSDMLNVAKDLISYFKNGPYRPIYTFVDSSLITPFQEKHQNINAGVFLDITFKTAESYAACDLPLRDFQIISEIPGGQVIFLGDIYTTGASLVDNTAVFQRNDGKTYSLDLSGFSSGTPSLSGLSDVLIVATPSNGDSLVYNLSINKWEPGITAVNYDRLYDFSGTYSYSGTAPQGTSITASLWDITRIQYFGSGTGSISTSTQSVPWVDRYIVTYV